MDRAKRQKSSPAANAAISDGSGNKKNLELTHLESLSQSEANKYKVYISITESLPQCRSMEELEARLLKQGIETQYKYKSGTNEKQGVSFKIGEDCFKGSMVDRKFSFAGLEKALELQHKQLPEQRQKSNNLESYSNQKHTIWQSSQAAVSEDNRKDVSHDTTTGVERTIDILLKPEQRNEQTPYAFSQNANQRKKKRRSQRL